MYNTHPIHEPKPVRRGAFVKLDCFTEWFYTACPERYADTRSAYIEPLPGHISVQCTANYTLA